MIERLFKYENIELNYISATSNHKKDILLLHGSCSRWQSFKAVLPELATHFNVHAIDLRGHGKSSRANSYQLEDHVGDVQRLIKDEIKKPITIFGNSLGGMIALMLAADHPNLVKALVLGDSPITTDSIHHLLNNQREFAQQVIIWLRSNQLEELYKQVNDMSFAENLSYCDPNMISALFDSTGSIFKKYEPEKLFSQLNCPTLIIRGEHEKGSLIKDGEMVLAQKWLPTLKDIKIHSAGHSILQEKDSVTSAIDNFMKQI